ncbi:uncharacterized protein RJT21DRAFT_118517 [Scheffersomyces amazonensis]|uniref:uncharacterized protein n=1 Tax=Scheffersomyces amazonensis TaxID=1078765 RepID=UPI00315D47E1
MSDINPNETIKDFIFSYVDESDFYKYLRLAIVVCAYIIFRKYYAQWAGSRATKHQLAQDEKEKLNKPEKDRKAREEAEKQLEEESKTFGWGKQTRKNVKLTQAFLEETLQEQRQRHQTAYDMAEDHDIEDLLED